MKLIFALLLFLGVSCCSSEGIENRDSFKVMTFNIRFDNPGDGLNSWDNRKSLVIEMLETESPDIIGMQEVLERQLTYFHETLEDYYSVGVGRDDGKTAGEYSPVLFRKDRFTVQDWGTFWLSPMPEDTGSVGWDAALTRICTWVRFGDAENGSEFFFLNTHFDHMGLEARKKSAELIIEFVAGHASGLPVILAGDFNCTPDEEPYHVLTYSENGFKDACSSVDFEKVCEMGTFNGFGNADETHRIDLILFQGKFKVESFELLKIKREDMFISDHWPVLAEISR